MKLRLRVEMPGYRTRGEGEYREIRGRQMRYEFPLEGGSTAAVEFAPIPYVSQRAWYITPDPETWSRWRERFVGGGKIQCLFPP